MTMYDVQMTMYDVQMTMYDVQMTTYDVMFCLCYTIPPTSCYCKKITKVGSFSLHCLGTGQYGSQWTGGYWVQISVPASTHV